MRYLLRNRWWQFLVLLFIAHQILEKGLAVRVALIDNYLDDLLCMPILLGGLLAERMDLTGSQRLSGLEIISCTILVTLIFEVILPGFYVSYTADFLDACCYAFGALIFFLFLNKPLKIQKNNPQIIAL